MSIFRHEISFDGKKVSGGVRGWVVFAIPIAIIIACYMVAIFLSKL